MFERNRIAETLRNAREKRGLSVEQAATSAGIPVQYVRLLEGESNVRIGVSDELYLVPFFRKYAGFMAIDAEEMLPEFLGMVQHAASEAAAPVRLAYRSRTAALWKPVAVVAAIAVAAMLLLRQARDRPVFDEAVSSDATAPIPLTEPSPTPRAELTAAAGSAQVVVAATAMPSSTTSSTPAAATTSVPTTDAHALTIVATEEAWLALGVDDQAAKQYLLRAGESRQWSAQRFVLTIGNAGGVTVSVDGRELPPIGRPGQVVRNLRLPATDPLTAPTPRER